jgi:branched-chain amino acid aminotransferase
VHDHVFHDGAWTAKASAVFTAGSIAMRYSVSAFEGIRLYQRAEGNEVRPFALEAHVRRLGDSLKLSRIPDPGIEKLPEIIDDLILRNAINGDAYVRASVSAGNAGGIDDEITPVLTVTATPMGRKRWLASAAGMRLQISVWQRAADLAFPSAAKVISNYAGPRLAQLEAKDAGFDGCVLVNAAGRLTEAPSAAFFIAKGNTLITPPLTEGVLPSITRRWVLDTAASLGLTACEAPVSRTDAYHADEAFLCGTGIEFAPVRSFDGRECSLWPLRPATSALIDRYFEEVRQ